MPSFNLKTKLGVASLIFDLHPPNFANLHNFLRCTNHITITFWYLSCFQIFQCSLTWHSFPTFEKCLLIEWYTVWNLYMRPMHVLFVITVVHERIYWKNMWSLAMKAIKPISGALFVKTADHKRMIWKYM